MEEIRVGVVEEEENNWRKLFPTIAHRDLLSSASTTSEVVTLWSEAYLC